MLKLNNVSVDTQETPVLADISLTVNQGEIHAILGNAHSGKSAVIHAIAGHPFLDVADGDITWHGDSIVDMEPDERYDLGIHSCFQLLPEFESLTHYELFTSIIGDDNEDIQERYNTCCDMLGLSADHGGRIANVVGMDVSQQKRNELIYMLMADPKLIMLDEIDEGLSDDEIIRVASVIKQFIKTKNRSCIVVSNNTAFLDILNPTAVHVMVDGQIAHSGDSELYERISNGDQ